MMSKTVILSVLSVFSMSAAYANQGKSGCEIKKTTLEKQLEYAQADKNERLTKGLTRTLENIKITCALEKRLKEQNNKPETVKNNLADGSPSLKQKNNKSQFHKSTKSSTIKTKKEVQANKK